MLKKWKHKSLDAYFLLFFLSRHWMLTLMRYYSSALFQWDSTVKSYAGTNSTVTLMDLDTVIQFRHPRCPKMHRMDEVTTSTDVSHLQVLIKRQLLIENVVSILTSLVLAVYSDYTTRRRPLVWMPSLGTMVASLLLIIDIYSLDMDGSEGIHVGVIVYLMAFSLGMSGGRTTFMVGSASFLSDMIHTNIAMRFLVVTIMECVAETLVNITQFIWIDQYGTHGLVGAIWVGFALSTFTAQIMVHEMNEADVLSRETRPFIMGDALLDLSRHIKSKVSRICSSSTMLLLIVCYATYTFTYLPNYSLFNFTLPHPPYCLSGTEIIIHTSLRNIYSTFGLSVMAGLTIYYNNHLLSIVGMVSMAVGIATYAFTTTTWAVYICTFLMLLQLAPFGLLRAEVGKLVRRTDEHKIALSFWSLHAPEALTLVLAEVALGVPLATLEVDRSHLRYTLFAVFLALVLVPLILSTKLMLKESKEKTAVSVTTSFSTDTLSAIEAMDTKQPIDHP